MNDKDISRRDFIKRLGLGAAATTAALSGCKSENNPVTGDHTVNGDVPTDKMTYRTNTKKGDKVSILGYGCMRWPMKKEDGSNEETVDQEAVNELRPCSWCQLLRHSPTVLSWSFRTSDRDCPETPPQKLLLSCDKDVESSVGG